MMATSQLRVQRPAFSASTTTDGSHMELRLDGNADTEVVTELASYLNGVHAAAQLAGVKEVIVDLRGLFFMTSSCFKCFLTWVSAIEELDETKRYVIRLEANANLHWQRRSLDALRNFATHVVSLNI